MITVCIYPESLGSPNKPEETATLLLNRLAISPPLPLGQVFQFKYGRNVRDILGGRGPGRVYMREVARIMEKSRTESSSL